ncbi:MAG: cohesin domain-containing protein [bacterium]|nr:cohesin domain-containing protein [bacterium]
MAKIYSKIAIFSFLVFSPLLSYAATLSVSPATGSYEVGNKVVVKVLAASNVSFNAVSGLLSFPSSLFAVESVSKTNSILNFWVTPPTASKTLGTVKFEGVAMNGFHGSVGTVVTVNLRAIKAGSAKLSFQSGQILANDGQGTDITGNLNGATYSIKEASVKPSVPVVPEPEEEVVPEVVQPAPSLKAPEIMLGSKYGASAIVGTSEHDKAQVLITFVAEDGAKVFITGASDDEGGFIVLIPNSLKQGKYEVTAVMIKADKANTETSNVIKINVGNIFTDISKEVWGLIALLILLILYLLIRIYFHLRRDKDKDKNIDQEKNKKGMLNYQLEKAEEDVHKSFKALEADVSDRARGIVNPVERDNIEALKKDIESTEQVIIKEIKDLEK